MPKASLPRRLGELDRGRIAPMSVRDEIRKNLIRKLRAGEPLFRGSSVTRRPSFRSS